MGVHQNITYDKFPKQGDKLNTEVQVCFWHDATKKITGKVVRDDMEEPFTTIFQLEDGRMVLATECQYQFRI